MLLRYIFIRSSKRSGADTEIPDADIFESDIRPSLEGHGIFEYILGISENIWYLVTQAMGHKASLCSDTLFFIHFAKLNMIAAHFCNMIFNIRRSTTLSVIRAHDNWDLEQWQQ